MDFIRYLLVTIMTFFLLSSCSSKSDTSQESKSVTDGNSSEIKNSAEVASQQESSFVCDYMGQEPPGDIPVKFAPGIISTKVDDSCFEISISGKEIVFTREGQIYTLKQDANSVWSKPAPLPFSGGETSLFPDGTKLYFNSRTSFPGAKVALNVWVSQKINGQWDKPISLGEPVINQTVHAPSVAANGNIYASGLIRLNFINGKYQPPEKLTPIINGHHPFIAPDESFKIFDKRQPGGGYGADLFITFQKPNATWTQPVTLGDKINTPSLETNAYITPDKKYMFFTRKFDIYWVTADFIATIKNQNLK